MSYADACPECMARDIEPAALDAYDDESTVASYVCVSCGCAWETSWWSAVDPSAVAADSATSGGASE